MTETAKTEAPKTETAKPAAEAKPKEKKAPKRGVGAVACEAIRAGKSNEDALAAVRKEFPEANTTMSSINWYRNKLRQDGEPIKSAREMKAEAKPAKEPKASKGKKGEAAPAADAGDPTA